MARVLRRVARPAAAFALALAASPGLAACSNSQGQGTTSSGFADALATQVQLYRSDMPQGWSSGSTGLTSQPALPDVNEVDSALAECMSIPNPWSLSHAELKSKVFHDPNDKEVASVVTEVDDSTANAESRMAALTNSSYPQCMSLVDGSYLRRILGPLLKENPGAELGPVAVQVTVNATSSGVRSTTMSTAFQVADGSHGSVSVIGQTMTLQEGPVVSRVGIELDYTDSESPPAFPALLLKQLVNVITTRLSERVALPNSDAFGGGTVIDPVDNMPGNNDGYAIQNARCIVNKSNTTVLATGTFAGTQGMPLPVLPAGTTYNVTVAAFDGPDTVDGVSASNQQTGYINHGGQWSVEVPLQPGAPPTLCSYSIGTYITPPLATVAPPVPIPPSLN